MCTLADFWPRIGRIPLFVDRDLSAEAVLCRTADNEPVRVTKPEYFKTDDDREAHISTLEMNWKKNPN